MAKAQPKPPEDIDAEVLDVKPKDVGPQSLMRVVGQNQLTTLRDPEVVLTEAKKVADALIHVIASQPDKKKVMMNGEQYITFDGWQLVGNFYACVPKIASDQLVRIDMGDGQPPVIGYEATADLIHIPSGNVISSATAMCLNDEDKWSEKNKYAFMYVCRDGTLSEQDPGFDNIVWEDTGIPKNDGSGKTKKRPKKQRELVGTVRVPLFQLRSMAQTRASAKVLREVFSHIVILAGFSPTPAEEMIDETFTREQPPESAYEDRPQTTTPLAKKVVETAAKMEQPPAKTATRKPPTKKAATTASTPPPKQQAPPPPPPPPPPQQATPPRTTGTGRKLSPAQVRRFWVIARTAEWTEPQVRELLASIGVEHTEDIPAGKTYDNLCDRVLPGGWKATQKGRPS